VKDLISRQPVLEAFQQRTRRLLSNRKLASRIEDVKRDRSSAYTVTIVNVRPETQGISGAASKKHATGRRRSSLKK
jgi:hypothetical protein